MAAAEYRQQMQQLLVELAKTQEALQGQMKLETSREHSGLQTVLFGAAVLAVDLPGPPRRLIPPKPVDAQASAEAAQQVSAQVPSAKPPASRRSRHAKPAISS